MRLGVVLRVMGPASTRATLLECAQAAEQTGIDDLWVVDHIAIPPDDAEGSGGRYLDALATLAFLAGVTDHIGLGISVLILPYRPALPTAKWIATIQELSGSRMRLGVGIGWMRPEFQALGIERSRRGALADETLRVLERCFEAPDDIVELNGQRFLFRPRPTRPPLYIGGAAPHALKRAVRFGAGWIPMGSDPEKLQPAIARLHELARQAGRPQPEVIAMGALPADDPVQARRELAQLESIGVSGFIHGGRYGDAAGFHKILEALAQL